MNVSRPATSFNPTLRVETLPSDQLVELWRRTVVAHTKLFHLWERVAVDELGDEQARTLARDVAPGVDDAAGLDDLFFADLDTMAGVVESLPGMLTVAEWQEGLLERPLTRDLDPEALSPRALALLWNVTALAYMFLTNRWYEAVAKRLDEATAQRLEKLVWLDRGAAEEDLRIGLEAAGAAGNDVEALLAGFQLAPGEVGLLEVEFDLEDSRHGWLIHRRCPAWDRFGNRDAARREHSCVICVIGMRLSGERVNEKIRCRAAALPPYREPTDHACKWEYWMEDE